MSLLERIKRFLFSLRYILRRTHIKVVHEDDLRILLHSLDIYDGIEQGEYVCMHCNEIITIENLWGILRKDDTIHVVCSNADCISKFE